MKEVRKKIGSGREHGKLKAKFLRLLRADTGAYVSIVGQSEARRNSHEEIRSATLNADRAKAIGTMEWQKSRHIV